MQVEKLSNTIHKFELTLGTFYVNLVASIGADGILLVDTGWGPTAEGVKEKLGELSDGIVKLIIFTHQHGDHIGGRHVLGENATLISHKTTKDELAGKYHALDPIPGQELPLIPLEGELSLRFNGENIKIIPAPGHTHSDMVVYFVNSGVACMGDLLFSDTFPTLFPAWGGNADQYLETIRMLTEELPDEVKLIAGHGRDYTLDELKAYHEMAVGTVDVIKQRIADGKNAEQMIEDDILKDWEKWNSENISSSDWITQVYESLTGQGKKPASEPLTQTIMDKGVEAAIEQYRDLKANHADGYTFTENDLNMLGYQLLWREMNEPAIAIHKLNIEEYPDSANPYDSLGETYEASGRVELAIEAYEKALELNPDMPSAIEALKKLRVASED